MFLRTQVISRGAGRNIVAAAAYRHRTTMIDELSGMRCRSQGNRAELVHEELTLPEEAPDWIRTAVAGMSVAVASQTLWNAVDEFEKTANARLARELIIALPKELMRDENIALAREFIRGQVTARGMVADWVYHDKPGNPHIHLLMTLRPLTENGFGPKKIAMLDEKGQPLRLPSLRRPKTGELLYANWDGDKETLREWKITWAEMASRHLALAGHEIRLDGRSYEEQGIGGIAKRHLSPAKAALRHRGEEMFFAPTEVARKTARVERLLARPELLLIQLANERSTFDQHDIARRLHRYVDDPTAFANIHAKLMASDELVLLKPQQSDAEVTEPAVYTTYQTLRTEWEMAMSAENLARMSGFTVSKKRVRTAIEQVEDGDRKRPFQLDAQQVDAIHHVTADGAIAAVVGLAGSGKSTLLQAARIAWEGAGKRVIGAALSGKAAEGLEASSGIRSRTLASWELGWGKGHDRLDRGAVIVIDEAGMVSSKQMARMLKAAEEAQAKVVLVGDAMQLQPIGAGAAFRAIAERIGFAELSDVRRQQQEWARAASRLFAQGDVEQALDTYAAHGHVIETQSRDEAIDRIVADWSQARAALLGERRQTAELGDYRDVTKTSSSPRPHPFLHGDELLVLAHTNESVKRLNEALRAVMVKQGALSATRSFRTERGMRELAVGDRIVFLENARISYTGLARPAFQAVKNGMLGTIQSTTDRFGGTLLSVRLDNGRKVTFEESQYRNIDYGYAGTIHKSQGTTVERSFVLAANMMDRHLTYVAMTRHRQRVDLYAAREDFALRLPWDERRRVNQRAGVTGELIDVGQAKFREGADVSPSPYVDLRTDEGKVHRLWGVGLPTALAKSGATIGDSVTLRKDDDEPVSVRVAVVDEGTDDRRYEVRRVARNIWAAQHVETAEQRRARIQGQQHRPKLFKELVERLSRSDAKSTTLDYEGEASYLAHAQDFARRRGLIWLVDKAGAMEDAVHRQLELFAQKREQLSCLWVRAGNALSRMAEKEQGTAYDDGRVIARDVDSPTIMSRLHANTRADHSLPTQVATTATASPDILSSNQWKPIEPLIAASTEFRTSIEEDARRRALKSAYYRHRKSTLLEIAGSIWRNPQAAVQTIEDLLINGVSADRVAKAVSNDPAAYDAMRGSGRMVDRLLAAGRERRNALNNIPLVAGSISSLSSAFASVFEAESSAIAGERRRMGIVVPGLSKMAQEELVRLTIMAKQQRRLPEEAVIQIDPRVREEFASVAKALSARFGSNVFVREDNDVAQLMSRNQHRQFESLGDSLRILQKLAVVDRAREIRVEQATRSRSIEI